MNDLESLTLLDPATSWICALPMAPGSATRDSCHICCRAGRPAEFIDVVLRLQSPVQGLYRVTTEEVELHGVTILARSLLHLRFGAANAAATFGWLSTRATFVTRRA